MFKETVSQSGYSNTILCVAGIELKREERENWEREWTWYQERETTPTLDWMTVLTPPKYRTASYYRQSVLINPNRNRAYPNEV